MILNDFPDIHWLKRQIQQRFLEKKAWSGQPLSQEGWPTVLLNVKTRLAERDDILGPFSVFMNVSGSSIVQVGRKAVKISDSALVISNEGDRYSLFIQETTPTETLNLHFGQQFYAQALTTLTQTSESLLDNPFEIKSGGLYVPFHSFYKDQHLNGLVADLFSQLKLNRVEDLATQEKLFALFAYLLPFGAHEKTRIARLSALKYATRQEIASRLATAVDLMHEAYQQPVTLDTLAEAACLSKFHLIRVFKEAYHMSPYQYLKKIRIEKAYHLLLTTEKSISEIATAVGLENGSSLSRLFYQHYGQYPTALRLQAN